ncbi:hypothetical protein MKX03_019420, partial [Papaver bracteatum]
MLNTAITAALNQRLGQRGGTKDVAPPEMNGPVIMERNMKSWVQYYQDFLKMKPPVFTGKKGATEAHQWYTKVDRILSKFDCSGAFKQRMAAFLLEENAATWWESMGRTVDAMEVTWTRFKELFLEHFFPSAERQAMIRQFEVLEQKENQLVVEYECEFDRLSIFAAHLMPTEEDRIDRFLGGFHNGISRHIIGNPSFNTYAMVVNCARAHCLKIQEEMKNKASRVDNKVTEKKDNKGGNANGQKRHFHQGNQGWKKPRTEEGNNGTGTMVHAPQPMRTEGYVFKGPCYHCQAQGHKARDCPNKGKAPAEYERRQGKNPPQGRGPQPWLNTVLPQNGDGPVVMLEGTFLIHNRYGR